MYVDHFGCMDKNAFEILLCNEIKNFEFQSKSEMKIETKCYKKKKSTIRQFIYSNENGLNKKTIKWF